MKKIQQNVYVIYTILFIIIVGVIFSIFFINDKTFIWQADGLKQHFIILKDFHEAIREFISNPSNGLDLFSWEMGLGMDVIGQYSYYVLGDPFAYLSLLFPTQYLEIVYSCLIILRLYFIGIAFIQYAKYHHANNHQNSQKNILLGAILYTFSSFALFAGVRHPYFLNAMILFPFLLLGVDKLLKENKKVPLTVWVVISAISNYYFFYMHTIMIVIYAIIRYLCEYRKEGVKHFFRKLGSGILIYLIGILCGLLNGLFASGAGQVLVVYLIFCMKKETHLVRAVSVAVLATSSIFAIIGYSSFVDFDIKKVIVLSVIAAISGFVGAKLMKKIPANVLNITSGVLIILLTGYKMFFGGN